MFKRTICVAVLGFGSFTTWAESCADCLKNYEEHSIICKEDTMCQERVDGAYKRCIIACPKVVLPSQDTVDDMVDETDANAAVEHDHEPFDRPRCTSSFGEDEILGVE